MKSRAVEMVTFAENVLKAVEISSMENGGTPASVMPADLTMDYTSVVNCEGLVCTALNGKWKANVTSYVPMGMDIWQYSIEPTDTDMAGTSIGFGAMNGNVARVCEYKKTSSKGKMLCSAVNAMDARYTLSPKN